MLSINNIEVVYDNVILVLKGVSLEVQAGAITTLLGANGAGKTTTLKAISGVLGTERGSVTKGSIVFDGKRIDGMRPFDVTKLGVSQVFEGRRVFEHLTTEENLVAGGHVQKRRPQDRQRHRARLCLLSAAQGAAPPAVGLSVRRRAADAGDRPRADVGAQGHAARRAVAGPGADAGRGDLRHRAAGWLQQEKLSVLLVEQNAIMALAVAQHGYVMETGRIVLEGSVQKLRDNSDIREFYLGLNEVGSRKSYRDVKHYKRRKRWLS